MMIRAGTETKVRFTAQWLALSLLLGACAQQAASGGGAGPGASGAGASGGAPGATPAAHLAQLPPLVDREVFFDDPEITGAQLSPNGKYLTFRKPYRNVMNIWWKKIDQPFEAARPLTADTARPVKSYFWSEDSKYVLYNQDKGGDENYRIYAVDPTAPIEAGSGVPPARDLTPFPEVRAVIYDVPEKTPGSILIGLNDRDRQLHDLYRLDLKTGKRTLVLKNEEGMGIVGWVFDLKGKLRLGVRLDKQGGTEIVRVDGKRLSPVYGCTAEESCSPVRFHKDGKRVYLVTNKGTIDLARLVLFDPATKQEEPVDSDPENQVDLGDLEFSDATEELVATVYEGDRMRVYPKTPEFARDWELVRKALPDGDLHFGSGTEDDSLRLVSLTSDVDPGATYLYDRKAGKVTFLYRPYPRLPVQHLAPMKPVRYQARDGVEVPAYLTIPKGVNPAATRLPAIVLPHGGPWARDSWGYSPLCQFLANRGYVVLQPNFRGSTGYGKKFLNLGNKQWGTGTMQHDISDGVAWLQKQGIADPRRVGIAGGSYGGFATLAGLAFTPELYAAGVDIVGPSSIPTLLASIPPYWAPLVKIFHVRVGDPGSPADAERLKAQSPLHSATKIRAPLLIIQGANDPRVKQAESDQIVTALRDLGREVAYVVAPDEGHGFAGRENRLAMYAAMERFLARHLGGRAQTEMPPAIAERLAKLTVDVKTVKKPNPAALPKAALAAARFTGEGLKASTLRYSQKVQMGGQLIEARSVLQVGPGREDKQAVWVVEEKVEGPMGKGTDRTVLDRKTLMPLRRTMEQGPARVELAFADTTVKGNVKLPGREMPIDAKIERRVVADGTPLNQALRTLPLSSGYTSTLTAFDALSGQAKEYRVTVMAAEQVEVPAGKFLAYRVELTPSDGPGGSTVWIEEAADRRVIKSESKLPPQAGGGTATTELLGGS